MEKKQLDRFLKFISEDDRDFFDKYLANLSEEELEGFLAMNPDFLKE